MAHGPDGMDMPRISRPTRQIVLMLVICGAVAAGGVLIWPQVRPVFLSSPYLNGTIGLVFVVGVLACFFQVSQLYSSVAWIERLAAAGPRDDVRRPPRLLASMTNIARMRGARTQVTGPAARSVLESVGSRMEESRDITRYIANLLIFLGLLGTFFGLATTVPAVVETIRSLQPGADEEGVAVFARLIDGLEDQLGGMGTAFASSLLGLAGSLVVGLLALYAGHGQNRFYRALEEWLAGITRVTFLGDGDGGGVDRTAIATILDHMVEHMETLQSLFSQSEARRAQTETHIVNLAHAVQALTDKLGPAPVEATQRLAAAQDRLSEVLEEVRAGSGIDEESKMRLRSIDVQLLKVHEDMGAARATGAEAIRADLAELTLVLRDLTDAVRAPVQTRRSGGGA